MSEMVERVMVALAASEGMSPDFWEDDLNRRAKTRYRKMAVAAVTAMREPTEDMLSVGPPEPYMDRGVWAKMIDEALQNE